MSVLLAAGSNGKVLWYLTRGTGVVALLLLTAGVVLGVMSSTRWQSRRLPRFLVSGLHRNITLLAVVFVAVHVVTTIVDGFAPIGLKDAFLPFLSPYRPFWLGLGAVAFDLLLALIVTSLLRTRIGVRVWRGIHWLAYASWPVALLHTLGTGSDVRTGWLMLLTVTCTGAVVLSVLSRVAAAVAGTRAIRIGAVVSALAVPVGILVWAGSGPLASGWAARAGTPTSLLPSSRVASTGPVAKVSPGVASSRAPAREPSLPHGSFRADFHGRLTQAAAGSGLVTVAINGTASHGFSGRVHIALRGTPLGGGGVNMIDSSVGLLPNGASAWSAGRVIALQGQRILADVQGPRGPPVRVLLALQIDAGSGRVTGVIRGAARALGAGENGAPSE